MDNKDQTICNQAKALEGMRERLRSRDRKLQLVKQEANSIRQSYQEQLAINFKLKIRIAELTSQPDTVMGLRNKYSSLQGQYYKLWQSVWTFLGALQMSTNNLKGELENDPDRPRF